VEAGPSSPAMLFKTKVLRQEEPAKRNPEKEAFEKETL
jgi:hypothetical protein